MRSPLLGNSFRMPVSLQTASRSGPSHCCQSSAEAGLTARSIPIKKCFIIINVRSFRVTHIIRGEVNIRETFRDVRIPNSVPAPNPTPGIRRGWRSLVSVETGEIHSPNIPFARRERALISFGQPRHSGPGKSQLCCPTAIAVLIIVDRTIDVHGRPFAGKSPFEVAKALAAGMRLESDAIKGFEFRPRELRRPAKAGSLISFLPNEKRFVSRIEGIHL